jgi:hypothetical protein
MLGFELTVWDYALFATAALAGVAGLLIYVWIAGLPGRIAIARNHPEAEAVKLLGWSGLLPTIVPWIQAFIWAFKPTDVVDIRRFPAAEARAIEEDIARLRGETEAASAKTPDDVKPPPEAAPDDTTTPPTSGPAA